MRARIYGGKFNEFLEELAKWPGMRPPSNERKVLVDELLDEVSLFPDHWEIQIAGAPRMNVLLEEIGVQTHGVRGGT